MTSTAVSTVPATIDQFMHTPEFWRHFVDFVHVEMLMVLRLATKGWNAVADALIDEGVRSGELMVHGGKDISNVETQPRKEGRKLITRVIFLLNITKIGKYACYFAVNLVVVDIPEGVESIGVNAFFRCRSLATVFFPTTLTSIGQQAFHACESLETVDLLLTRLQRLDGWSFEDCSELKSMTIPDSLQTLGKYVFQNCTKIVPSNIDVRLGASDATPAVIAHLRSHQLPS